MDNLLLKILQKIKEAGGRGLAVGGYVRDKLLGIQPKDIDIEVYGLAPSSLTTLLSDFGKVDTVGASFGVIKLYAGASWYDFSIPRRENKQGRGHKGFLVDVDPTMTAKEAAARRDFTMNAIAEDPLTGEVFDFYCGREDIKSGMLMPTSEAFREDALRVLRGMQFAARFEMISSYELIKYAKEMFWEYEELSIERVWGEWQKLCEKGKKPSMGLFLLTDTGWIDHYPELKAIVDVPQDPVWHPEGDAFLHTCYVADAAANIADREGLSPEDRCVLVLAAICHDLGKATTTVFERDRWRSPGHADAGVPLAESFLKRIGAPIHIIERVKPLVRWHMIVVGNKATKRIARKLSVEMQPSNIAELILLIEADASGRPPIPPGLPEEAQRLCELAVEVGGFNTKPVGFVMGRHLLARGMQPGPQIGIIVREAYEAQIQGIFDTQNEAENWLDKRLKQE